MENLYETKSVKKYITKKHNPSFASTQIELNSRVLCIGGSGSGKTHALVHYVMKAPNTFAKIVVVSKNISEPLYELLKERLNGRIVFYGLDELPTLTDLHKMKKDKTEEWLVIFDDIVNDVGKDSKISNYFIAGRKLGFTQWFLSQSYFKIPKILRQQAGYLILLRLSSNKDLKLILSDFALGIEPDDLVEMYRVATREKFHFLKVDIDSTDMDRKFSKDFTEFFKASELEDDDD